MCWCVIHAKENRCQELMDFFNREDMVYAFMPKIEKWFSSSRIKEYQLSLMYPDYIFVKANMSQDEFDDKYSSVFASIGRFADVLGHDGVVALNTQEQSFLEHMLDSGNVVRHSIGRIENSVLTIDNGPLKGMENSIKKINRHKRIAILDCGMLGKTMKVPLEVVSKS